MTDIPSWLTDPPTLYRGNSPVISLKQELPFSELEWENFERLCLRLAREYSNIEGCSRLYGVAGDTQEGIDIYGKKSTAVKYTVHQCKREKNFGPQKIKDAVDTFLTGKWVNKTEEFILCTQESLRSKQREDEVIRQQEILQKQNISFRIWDLDELNIKLKKFPQIVYDFFGMPWCEVFCGPEVAATVKPQKILPRKKPYAPIPNYLERLALEASENSIRNVLIEGKPLSTILKSKKRIALLGPGYHGKSTELEHLAFTMANETTLYPFLVRLKSYTGENIQNYVQDFDEIPHDQILVLLDGFDEVQTGQFDSTRRKIEKFAEEYPEIHIIVSCRRSFYFTYSKDNTLDTLHGFSPYTLLSLSRKQVDRYLDLLSHTKGLNKANFLEEISRKRFEQHLYTPYYLIRLVNQFIEEGVLAENIAEITERLIQENIRKDVARYFPENRAGKEKEIYAVLQKVAFVLEYTGKNNCTWEELQSMVTDVKLIKAASSMFEGNESENALWSFTHNNFQEVLVAKALEKAEPATIRKIVSFAPSYTKVRPTWSNTISLIIAILDSQKRKNVIDWLNKDQQELIIRSEPNVIDEQTRFNVFKDIFNHYTNKGSRINDSKYGIQTLASFSKSELTGTFLYEKLVTDSNRIARINALEVLTYFNNIELDFIKSAKGVKTAIEDLVYGPERIPYNAIRAYANGFRLTEPEFEKLFRDHVQSKDTWVLSALYSAVLRQGKQEIYLKDILQIIIDFIESEHSEREGRLADEYMLLSECVTTISSINSVKELLDFLKVNYDKVFYSTYFREIIDFALKIAAKLKSDPSIYQKVKDIFMSEGVHLADNRNSIFLEYFRNADQLLTIFKDVYRSQAQVSRYDLLSLSKLASPEAIDFIVDEFRKGQISEDSVTLFQTYLYTHNNHLLSAFNKKINTVHPIPLPIFKDYATEKKKQNDATRELLFDQSKFIGAVDDMFKDLGKDEMTYDEMWGITRGSNDGIWPPVLYEVIRFRNKDQVLRKGNLIDKLKKVWDQFFIEEVYRFLKNDKTIEVSDTQKQIIRQWCDEKLKNFSFTSATKKTRDGYSVNQNAVYLSFFIRRFNFKDYEENVYLDMLSFQKWDDDDLGIFDFVTTVVSREHVEARVLFNLSSENLYPAAFDSHLSYIREKKLKNAASLLIRYIEKPESYQRHEALRCFQELGGDFRLLEKSLGNITDNFRFEIIKLLISVGSASTDRYVHTQFRKCKDPEEKLRFAFFLIQRGKLAGIRYFISYINRQKEVPVSPDAPFSNFLGNPKKIALLPFVFEIYRMGYRPDVKQTDFNSLQHTASTALNSICLTNDNFRWAKRIFSGFRMLKNLEYILTTSDTTKKTIKNVIRDLDFYFENMEQQYYINKATKVAITDATRDRKKVIA